MHRLAGLFGFLVFSFPLFLGAQQGPAYQEMLRLSDDATEAVLDGELELGAITFRKAYTAYPDPILLKNEMIAWFRADDCRAALAPAHAFLQTEDAAPQDREDVRTVQVECHLRLADESLAKDQPLLANYHLDVLESLELRDDEPQRLDALRRRLPAPQDSHTARTAGPGAGADTSPLKVWLPIVAGVGLLGAGSTVHFVALDRQAQLDQFANSDRTTDAILLHRRQEDWRDFQNRARWLVPTLYALGVASIGVGTFFRFTAPSPSSETLTLSPTITGDSLGMDFITRF